MSETLSLTHKRWILRPDTPSHPSRDLIPFLLRERGIDPRKPPVLTHPSVFPDMKRAVERIERAIEKGERVGIFGDYDCDGVTATAQLVRYFRRHGVEPIVRLPHREHDGYGLSPSIIDELTGLDLLLTVDTGISSVAEIAQAQEQGTDVIVTDHHHLQAEVPPAYAILHPALAPNYPEPHPSGAGVALSLVRALEGERWEDMQTDVALAAIGTVADLVELRGDNRALVQSGLTCLTQITEGPLAVLKENAGLTDQLTSGDIAFRIAPRLNAAGRMADPRLALLALLEGGEALEELEELNRERQEETESLFEELLATIETDQPLLFAASEAYPPGIVGLLAGRLTERFGKPSLVATIAGETCTASLRSPKAYHVTEGLGRVQELLTRFGGHARAAGCTFPLGALSALRERLTADVCDCTTLKDLQPTIAIDATLDPQDVTIAFCEKLSLLEPFGMGNPEPLFLLPNVQLEQSRCVGSDALHLQSRIGGIKAIGFRLGDLLEHTTNKLDVVCRLGIDTWQGAREPQIVIVDLATPASDSLPSQKLPSPARQMQKQS